MSSSLASSIAVINKDELTAAHAAATNVEGWSKLVDLEKATVAAQNDKIKELAAALKSDESRVKDAKAKKDAAEKRIAELKEKIAAKQKSGGNTVESYSLFVSKIGAIAAGSILRRDVFNAAGAYTRKDLRYAELTDAFAFADGWATFADETQKSLTQLQADAKKFADEGADVASTEVAERTFQEAKKAFAAHSKAIVREQCRRAGAEAAVKALIKDQEKLLQWCRQQRSTLEGLQDPEHIQEFCTSFQNNIAAMETNFLVLMEAAEPLVPNVEVEKALIEVSEVWLSLEVFAFEKLRGTLLDAHMRSNLENEAKLWADYSLRLNKFLRDAEGLLEISDEESQAVTKPVLESCRGLLLDHDAHLIIVEHLADFSLRDECIKDHYSAIRRTVFSKLTLLTQSFLGRFEYPRKQEYTDRLAELTDWVECKAQSDAWKQLLSRVDRMRGLIEENEASHGTEERY